MGKLTVRKIESANAKAAPYKLIDGDGLQLRVATNGIKTWLVRYMINGTERQYRLPRRYRDTGGEGFASLQDARAEAAEIRALARKGIDYQIQLDQSNKTAALRLIAERAANKNITDLFEAWLPTTNRKDKGKELRRMFGRDVLPFVGVLPVKDLTEDKVRALLHTVVARGSNRLAVMLLADLKQMFRWAEKKSLWRKLIEDNPVEGIHPDTVTADDYDDSERTRCLSAEEIQELSIKLPLAGLSKRTQIACWIMLSCCCRIGELIKAKWSEIDLDARVWTIPKENAKNKSTHLVFLSDFAIRYFEQLREISKGEWCYPDASGENHVCDKSTTKQIRDRQMSAMNRKPMKHRSAKANALVLSSGDWIPHDLRRTGSTLMQQLKITPMVIERVLNHTEPSKLKRTYHTYEYAEEKREAWRMLGEKLDQLIYVGAEVIKPTKGKAKPKRKKAPAKTKASPKKVKPTTTPTHKS
jgi:integrase